MVELVVLLELCLDSVDQGEGGAGGESFSQPCIRGWRGVERDGRRA